MSTEEQSKEISAAFSSVNPEELESIDMDESWVQKLDPSKVGRVLKQLASSIPPETLN